MSQENSPMNSPNKLMICENPSDDETIITSPIPTSFKVKCDTCGEIDDMDCTSCDKCLNYFRYKCINITEQELETIDQFYCEDNHKLWTTFIMKDPTSTQASDKKTLYYTVEEILDHRTFRNKTREFFVKWKDYPTTSVKIK